MSAERLELVTRLNGHAGIEAGIEELIELRENYYKNLARTLSMSVMPVDQRDVDYKRGFWNGALWAFREFPTKALRDLDKELEKALKQKEGEDAGR